MKAKLLSERIDVRGNDTWTFIEVAIDEPFLVEAHPGQWREDGFYACVECTPGMATMLDTGESFVVGRRFKPLGGWFLSETMPVSSRSGWSFPRTASRKEFMEDLIMLRDRTYSYLAEPYGNFVIVEFIDPNGVISLGGTVGLEHVFRAKDLRIGQAVEP